MIAGASHAKLVSFLWVFSLSRNRNSRGAKNIGFLILGIYTLSMLDWAALHVFWNWGSEVSEL